MEPEDIVRLIKQSRGTVANIHSSYMSYPIGVKAHYDFYESIVLSEDGPLPRKIREVIASEVSKVNQCEYCIRHHSKTLEIWQLGTLSETEKKFFEKFSLVISKYPERLSMLRPEFPFRQIEGAWEHAIMIGSYFNMANRLAHAMEITVEEDFHLSCH